jgi:hypothetical protein
MVRIRIIIAASFLLIILTAVFSYHLGIRFLFIDPSARAATKPSLQKNAGSYLTKNERDEYKEYLMEQENESKIMFFDEWKLSKVFKKTLTQLEKENGY